MPDRTSNRSARGSRSGARRGGPSRSSSNKKSGPSKPKGPAPKPLTPTLDPPDIESFTEFDLGAEIQQAIADMGITKPTPIQALAIEPVLNGKDVIAKAETGTGKTLAFGAPMMAKIDPARASVLGLVMSPTRELAEQVHKVLEELGKARGVKTALIVGGEPLGPQVKKLQAGAQVIVGTPGRVLDLLNQKFLQFPWTEFAILDEADKMLEIGFIDDIKKILDACNEYRQTLLFSATFPPELLNLARGYTGDPVEIATASGVATVDTINQYVFRCGTEDYAKNIAHLIEDSAPEDVFLVFCERRTDVDQLMRKLERKRFSVKALHGGYDQAARFRVMTAFRTGDVKALVATDVASRGLDVAHVTHVVNLGLPREFSDYTHRIGRTGRAGRHGAAVTFISGRNERDFQSLLKHTGFDIDEIERPRDLYVKERKRAAERNGEVIDVEAKPRERKSRDREERPEREERPRRNREAGAERKPRRPREDRPEREEKPEREPRPERRPRSEREPRPERRPRSEREPRPEREPRAERKPRSEREARPEREPRAEREAQPEREARPKRRSESASDEAAPRERRPRRERKPRAEAQERVEVEETAPTTRPRRQRRPRRDAEESTSSGSRAEESPERESRPRRARGDRTRTSNAREVEAAPPLESREPRKRRPRKSAEAQEGAAGPFADEAPASEAPARRPRRPRRDATADEPRTEEEAPKRTRTRRPREDAPSEGAPERSRGGRRPRREAAASEDDSPRPRRPRRNRQEESQGESQGESQRESQRESRVKAESKGPKRAPVGETTRADSTPKPSRPAPGGGFGAGV